MRRLVGSYKLDPSAAPCGSVLRACSEAGRPLAGSGSSGVARTRRGMGRRARVRTWRSLEGELAAERHIRVAHVAERGRDLRRPVVVVLGLKLELDRVVRVDGEGRGAIARELAHPGAGEVLGLDVEARADRVLGVDLALDLDLSARRLELRLDLDS